VFVAAVFSGNLFVGQVFSETVYAFFIFCLLSSVSYVLNDIIDYPYDKKHPIKKNRPIASGKISIGEATFLVFILSLFTLIISLFFSINFFLLSFAFLLLHLFYSLYLKRFPVIDIFAISFSFMLRTFAGEVATGFHIPIWLLLSVFFGSLFIATVKRHAELLKHGAEARSSLIFYKEHLLDFLSNTFATTTIIAYASYAYFEKLPTISSTLFPGFAEAFPAFEARKWLMATIPFVVYGIARYAQLLYEKDEGEQPEKIIVKDGPLVATIFLWGLCVILLIYVL
jgi:4-hydroxybenzoate polyprenyltransferase